jgi:hypothetical protein
MLPATPIHNLRIFPFIGNYGVLGITTEILKNSMVRFFHTNCLVPPEKILLITIEFSLLALLEPGWKHIDKRLPNDAKIFLK